MSSRPLSISMIEDQIMKYSNDMGTGPSGYREKSILVRLLGSGNDTSRVIKRDGKELEISVGKIKRVLCNSEDKRRMLITLTKIINPRSCVFVEHPYVHDAISSCTGPHRELKQEEKDNIDKTIEVYNELLNESSSASPYDITPLMKF